jgi:hypothetical protein
MRGRKHRAERPGEQARVDRWNEKNPVGTPVEYRMGAAMVVRQTKTRELAALDEGRAVVAVEGVPGQVDLSRVYPVSSLRRPTKGAERATP